AMERPVVVMEERRLAMERPVVVMEERRLAMERRGVAMERQLAMERRGADMERPLVTPVAVVTPPHRAVRRARGSEAGRDCRESTLVMCLRFSARGVLFAAPRVFSQAVQAGNSTT